MKIIAIEIGGIELKMNETDLPLFWNALFTYLRLPIPKPHNKIGRPTSLDTEIINMILDNPDVASRTLANIIYEKLKAKIHPNTIWRYRHDHNLPQPKKGFRIEETKNET